MKRLIAAAVAFFASAGVTLAAGPEQTVTPGPFDAPPAFPTARPDQEAAPGPYKAPPAYAVVQRYDWTGFYLGINGGGLLAATKWYSTPDLVGGSLKTSGGLIGGTAGYNLQAGDAVVVGVEADMDWSSGAGAISPPSCAPCDFKVPWLATARLRLGYAFNAFLPYVTGGAAIGGLDANLGGTPFGTAFSSNLGWTVGGGLEILITEALRAKIEYLYVNLNGFSCYGPCGAQISGGPISFNPTGSVIRAGLNYRLWN